MWPRAIERDPPVRVRLGAFPDLSIEQARQAVRRMNGAVANGEDPQLERRARRAAPRLGDLWTLWQDRMKAKRPRSQEEDAIHATCAGYRGAAREDLPMIPHSCDVWKEE